jgi:PST family polysaccharide transporter
MSQTEADPIQVEDYRRTDKGITRRTIRAALWSSLGTIAQFVSNVALVIILARLLTPTDFGLAGAGLVVVSFGQIFGQVGISTFIVQHHLLNEEDVRTSFTLSILLGGVLTGAIALFAPIFAEFFQIEALVPVLRGLSLMFVIGGFGIVPQALLQRELRFRPLAIVQIVSVTLGYGLVGIVLAALGWGVWSLVAAQLGQALIETSMLLVARPHHKRLGINIRSIGTMIHFTSGMTLTKFAHHFAIQGDNMVVGRWLGAAALGLYSRAYRLMALPANLLGDAVEAVLFSSMSLVQDERERLLIAYRRGNALTALTVMPLSVIAIALAPEIVQIALGPQWAGAVLPLRLLSLGMYFRAGYKIGVSLVRAKGAVHRLALYQTLYAILVLSAALVGQQHGIAGVAFGVAIALVLYFIAQAHFTAKFIQIKWFDYLKIHFPAMIVTLMTFVASLLTATFSRDIGLSIAAVVLITLIVDAICVVGLIRFLPALALGPDGQWWIEYLSKYFLSQQKRKGELRDKKKRGDNA